MRVTVDRGRCVSAGNCASSAPEVFDQDENDGMVILLQEDVSDALGVGVEQAVSLCPVQIISVST